MKNNHSRILTALAIGAIVAVLFVTLATIIGELYKPFKSWLASTFLHHWLGKGIISVLLFGFISAALARVEQKIMLEKYITYVSWSIAFGFFAILIFYMLHYWGIV